MKTLRSRPSGKLAASASLALALLAVFAVPALRADDQGQPARAIRLSFVDGKAQLTQGDQLIADQAVINTPLLEGMTLSTAEDGKAEIQFEDGSVARLAPNTTLTLTTLSGAGASAQADMSLERGEAYFELQGNGQVGPLRVHFGDSVVTASGFTVLRVQYDTPPGAIAVFSGNAHIDRANAMPFDLHGGESLDFNPGSPNGYNLAESIETDSWDAWNSDRDQALNAESAEQTNAPADLAPGQTSNPAWSDLDSSGTWYNVPSQGYVWSPYDAANPGFDPYGVGNWVWMPGFGYTWASGYSWGYLPYSCGAWNFYDGFGWGWAPGFGGCNPWWNMGFYGGPVIGIAPGWYHRVQRPMPPREGPRRGRPVPMIAVNRNSPVFNGGLPSRDRNTPVTIAGATVVGMRPLPGGRTTPRPGIVVRSLPGREWGGFNNRPVYVTPRTTYNPPSQRGNVLQQPAHPSGAQPPGGSNGSSQPVRVFPPTPGRGNGGQSTGPSAVPSAPAPAPAPSAPAPIAPPRMYAPPTSRPSGANNSGGSHPSPGFGNSGGGYRPSPAPNPGGSGGSPRSGGSSGGGGNSGGASHTSSGDGHH